MPGLFGYVNKHDKNFIQKMNKTMKHTESLSIKNLLSDKNIKVSSSYLKNDNLISYSKNKIHTFLFGDIYSNYDKKDLYKAYISKTLPYFLKNLNGYFNCLIYDENINKLFLISDKYGLKPLFIYHYNNDFAFAAETKAILSLSFVNKKITKKAFNCFIDLGHFVGDTTWHKYIKMISPSTIFEYNLSNNKSKKSYYWNWSNVQKQNISFDNAINRLYNLFMNSMEMRLKGHKRIGLSLSGGLDSRLILASLQKLISKKQTITAFTFGTHNCDDMIIAKEIVKRFNINHKTYLFSNINWLEKRIPEVSKSDGMYSIMHMHGTEFRKDISTNIDVNFNGFLGDVILGASYIQRYKNFYNTKINDEIAKTIYGIYWKDSLVDKKYFNIDNTEPYMILNRGRRFIHGALAHSNHQIKQILPFLDNNLIDFIYSLPDEYRLNNKIYSAMLLKYFPELFENIPWQKTRRTLDNKKSNLLPEQAFSRGYLTYANEIRKDKILNYTYKTLNFKKSKYQNFTDTNMIKLYLEPHLKDLNQNYIDKIFNTLTAELYLRNY
ncbi:hypothetical protein CP965_07330 [Halarcobacter mediterraneus]|uniref:asparagine synthase (glutamine-hydrolyzing) n=1 Tax=Halarcobacter mediterraneus TaxID=2023153 RepID=A0A4Q1AWY9_9BACT|nr:asparagine synthase-related protein [Halarcobacter mediterraneus]RXK13601.1 hypothetical protein CP965_07330 [Halarcobacter mediterraneus]